MKKVFVYILSVIVVVLLVDVIFGIATRYYLNHYKLPGDYRSIDYVVRDANEDVMILGSSVALNSLMPGIIEDSLGVSCYNGAANGQQFPYYQTMIDYILKRYSPKIIILGITPDVCSYPGVGERYNILMPYYKSGNLFLDSCMESSMPFASLFYKSYLFRYNTIWWRILLYHFVSPDNSGEKGFVGKDVPMVLPELTETRLDEPMLKEREEQLKHMFMACKKSGVRLLVYFPPLYTRITGSNRCAKSFKRLCVENQVPLIDNSQDSVFLVHPEWFHDNLHLNEKGAELYTKQFVKELKKCLYAYD